MKYICGPSILSFPGGEPIQPGESFEHDFSVEGPHGEHGPAREAALIAAEAIAVAPPPSHSSERTAPIMIGLLQV